MSGNRFQFKHFTVGQDGCAMKVGTDGVLLGAWCRIEPTDKAILDIGTGTGVIALMLAQRIECASPNPDPSPSSLSLRPDPASIPASVPASTPAFIEAVEIDPASASQAGRNFAASPWDNRLKLYAMSIQEFAGLPPSANPRQHAADLRASVGEIAPCAKAQGARFDHIVSNPPYFVDSLAPPDPSRHVARHAETLSHEELISVCDRLLKPLGRVSLILPTKEAEKMVATAAASGFAVSRRTEVHSTPKSGVKRVLIEFSRGKDGERSNNNGIDTSTSTGNGNTNPAITAVSPPESSSLIIEDAGPGTFSAEYRALTRDFYLYF